MKNKIVLLFLLLSACVTGVSSKYGTYSMEDPGKDWTAITAGGDGRVIVFGNPECGEVVLAEFVEDGPKPEDLFKFYKNMGIVVNPERRLGVIKSRLPHSTSTFYWAAQIAPETYMHGVISFGHTPKGTMLIEGSYLDESDVEALTEAETQCRRAVIKFLTKITLND